MARKLDNKIGRFYCSHVSLFKEFCKEFFSDNGVDAGETPPMNGNMPQRVTGSRYRKQYPINAVMFLDKFKTKLQTLNGSYLLQPDEWHVEHVLEDEGVERAKYPKFDCLAMQCYNDSRNDPTIMQVGLCMCTLSILISVCACIFQTVTELFALNEASY